jgi:hypothetical protein
LRAHFGTWLALALLWALIGPALAAPSTAVVIGIEHTEGMPSGLNLVGAEARARDLGAVLRQRAGVSQVVVLTGASATRASIDAALQDSLASTDLGGTVIWVFEGHGVGGDYGDPHILASDSRLDRLTETAIDVAKLGQHASDGVVDRVVFVLLDTSHPGSLGRMALIGPTVEDWPGSAEWLGVVSAAGPGEVAPAGAMLPVAARAFEGAADKDGDGRITWGELSTFLVSGHGDRGLTKVHAAGGLSGDRVLVQLREAAPTPRPPEARSAPRDVPWKAISWGMLIAGGVSGTASLGMYAAKRSSCDTVEGQTVCGSGSGYKSYQRTQHSLGVVGGGLIALGAGFQFVGADDPVWVRVGGRF